MSQPGSEAASHVVWITRALSGPVMQARYSKYLVYYDGPVVDPDTCGAGEGYPDIGPGFAIVFLRACTPLVPSSCATTWNAGARLVLTASPAVGMRFVRWKGACSGAASCALTVRRAAGTVAIFAPIRR
jgi:Divergent InlB B-repeat domain